MACLKKKKKQASKQQQNLSIVPYSDSEKI